MTGIGWRLGRVVLACLLGLLIVGGGRVAHANPNELGLEVVSEQATLAPDGRSVSFHLSTRCDRKATVVDARVAVTQPQASGEATFTPTCNRLPTVVEVTVPSLAGAFQTGQAEVSARLVVREGRTKEVRDSAVVRVRPSVSVRLADQAALAGSGEAALIDATVTCPVAANGRGGQVTIYQGQVVGTGPLAATPCDGFPHTISVRVQSSGGLFQVGSAEAIADVAIEEGGDFFPGGDLRTIQIT